MPTKRRNFLGALIGGSAAAAMTAMAPPVAAGPTQAIVKEKLIWPDFLPPLVGQPETDSEETRRLLQTLLDAERELFTIPQTQDVTWNGLTFRLNAGANVIPAPIAYVYRLALEDQNANALEWQLRRKYRNTYDHGRLDWAWGNALENSEKWQNRLVAKGLKGKTDA